MGSEMEIRALKESDYDALTKLWKERASQYKPEGRDSRERIEKLIQENLGQLIGAFDGEKLVGTVLVTTDGRKGEISRLVVHPDYRRKGLARKLAGEAEKFLESKGIEIKFAVVFKDNSASLEFFKEAGYRVHDDVFYVSKRPREEA